MAELQGQGCIAQSLGIAEVLAVCHFHVLRYRADCLKREGPDRVCLSNGQYAIVLYAGMIAAGFLPEDELESYGADGIRLPMSGMVGYTHRTEITGGSLGHGLDDSIVVNADLALIGQTIAERPYQRNCRVRDTVLTATAKDS